MIDIKSNETLQNSESNETSFREILEIQKMPYLLMLDSLSALKLRAKKQIESARRQLPTSGVNYSESYNADRIMKIRMEEESRRKDAEIRQQRLLELQAADAILPAIADDEISRQVNVQYTDSWSRIISSFKRQLESTENLRVMMADQSVYEEQPTDHASVKFLKGIINEWRTRLFALSDEELAQKKSELIIMWYCLFSLQPLFEGMNSHNLSRDISVETNAICDELKKLNFKKAMDHYNNMAIGNAIWPIGVTQYSIHWKFSCDLIDSERMLHLFNNEPARNAILSIKRLMNKYEEYYKKC